MAGITLPEKRQILLNFFLQKDLHIVCLQEITFNHCPIFTQYFDMYTNLGPRKLGTAILVRHGFCAGNVQTEPEGRLISLQVSGLTFMCIYAPSGESFKTARDLFFRITVPAYFTRCKTPVIILGDFNAVEELSERRSNNPRHRQTNAHVEALHSMVKGLQLTDIWKAIRKDEPGWTFSYSGGQARLDRIYATKTLKFVDAFTHTLPFGDHSALASRVCEDPPS